MTEVTEAFEVAMDNTNHGFLPFIKFSSSFTVGPRPCSFTKRSSKCLIFLLLIAAICFLLERFGNLFGTSGTDVLPLDCDMAVLVANFTAAHFGMFVFIRVVAVVALITITLVGAHTIFPAFIQAIISVVLKRNRLLIL